MEMGNSLRVLVFLILLVFSQLLASSMAVPMSRTQALKETMRKAQQEVAVRLRQEVVMEGRRFDLEVDDYPGCGANNKHEPKPIGRK